MYATETYEMVFPKYAKVIFSINQAGNLSMALTPSFTPGKMPAGAVNGKLPKGTRVFDYDKEIITTVTFTECLAIIEFTKNKRLMLTPEKPNKVDIYKTSDRFEKRINFIYTADDNDPSIIKMATIYVDAIIKNQKNENGEDTRIKFYLPLSIKSLEEIAKICEAYVNNVHSIKMLADVKNFLDGKSNNDRTYNKKPSVSDIHEVAIKYSNLMEQE